MEILVYFIKRMLETDVAYFHRSIRKRLKLHAIHLQPPFSLELQIKENRVIIFNEVFVKAAYCMLVQTVAKLDSTNLLSRMKNANITESRASSLLFYNLTRKV
jgi:16S rRNA G966 N2-methylase RsmD